MIEAASFVLMITMMTNGVAVRGPKRFRPLKKPYSSFGPSSVPVGAVINAEEARIRFLASSTITAIASRTTGAYLLIKLRLRGLPVPFINVQPEIDDKSRNSLPEKSTVSALARSLEDLFHFSTSSEVCKKLSVNDRVPSYGEYWRILLLVSQFSN